MMWRCRKCMRIELSPRKHFFTGKVCDGEWEEGDGNMSFDDSEGMHHAGRYSAEWKEKYLKKPQKTTKTTRFRKPSYFHGILEALTETPMTAQEVADHAKRFNGNKIDMEWRRVRNYLSMMARMGLCVQVEGKPKRYKLKEKEIT